MSIKSIICSGDNFQLYSKSGDDYNMHLEIKQTSLESFSIDKDKITVSIPAPIF